MKSSIANCETIFAFINTSDFLYIHTLNPIWIIRT